MNNYDIQTQAIQIYVKLKVSFKMVFKDQFHKTDKLPEVIKDQEDRLR